MRSRVLRGRGIDRSDVDGEEPIVVVNQALVNIAFPGQDPIGQRVRFGNPSLSRAAPEWLTIVGVVVNTPILGLAEANPLPQLYMPMFASRNVNMAPRLDALNYVLRTSVTPAALTEPVRHAVDEVDSNLALGQVRTLQDTLDRAEFKRLGFIEYNGDLDAGVQINSSLLSVVLHD